MRTESEIKARLAGMEATIKAGPDNDLQASMWQAVLSAYETLQWVLDAQEDGERFAREQGKAAIAAGRRAAAARNIHLD